MSCSKAITTETQFFTARLEPHTKRALGNPFARPFVRVEMLGVQVHQMLEAAPEHSCIPALQVCNGSFDCILRGLCRCRILCMPHSGIKPCQEASGQELERLSLNPAHKKEC